MGARTVKSTREWLEMIAAFTEQATGHGSVEGLLLKHGREYEVKPLPADVARGPMGECYKTAQLIAAVSERYVYVEGQAKGSIMVTSHGWLVDTEDGMAIDPTWGEGSGYFGVEVADARWLARLITERGYASPVLFQWAVEQGWIDG